MSVASTATYLLLKIPTWPAVKSCVEIEPELGRAVCPTGTTNNVVNEKSAIFYLFKLIVYSFVWILYAAFWIADWFSVYIARFWTVRSRSSSSKYNSNSQSVLIDGLPSNIIYPSLLM